MDTILWIVIFIIVLLLVALLVPTKHSAAPAYELKKKMEQKSQLEEKKPTCEVIGPCERPCRYTSLNAEKRKYDLRADIDSQFETARPVVPNDYPLNNIGCCPYGRPLSSDLPMADVPMCMAKKSNDMRLHS